MSFDDNLYYFFEKYYSKSDNKCEVLFDINGERINLYYNEARILVLQKNEFNYKYLSDTSDKCEGIIPIEFLITKPLNLYKEKLRKEEIDKILKDV